MVQFVGVPFAFAFGALSDRMGAKRAILLALAVYAFITVYGFWLRTTPQFFVISFLVGTVMGGAQALSRSLFATLIPRHKAGEMFGFFGIFDRFGGALGTMSSASCLTTTGSSRPAIPGSSPSSSWAASCFRGSTSSGDVPGWPTRRTIGCLPAGG